MRPFEEAAVDFASALVAGDFERARAYLLPALQAHVSATELREQLFGMSEGYADGPPTAIDFNDEYSMLEWPSRQPGDVGWAYVSILGDHFVEAVSVRVSDVDGNNFIREIEWGRP